MSISIYFYFNTFLVISVFLFWFINMKFIMLHYYQFFNKYIYAMS